MKSQNAFTLIELIVVVTLLSILTAGAFIGLTQFYATNRLDNNVKSSVQMLRKARSYAEIRYKDSKWGVDFDDTLGKITFFKGSTYSTRDHNYDEEEILADSINISDVSINGSGKSVVFEMGSGETDNFGTITITGSGAQKTLSINKIGQIDID